MFETALPSYFSSVSTGILPLPVYLSNSFSHSNSSCSSLCFSLSISPSLLLLFPFYLSTFISPSLLLLFPIHLSTSILITLSPSLHLYLYHYISLLLFYPYLCLSQYISFYLYISLSLTCLHQISDSS